MSSPITISSSAQTQPASAARSLDSSNRTGLYVPVHRRNLSAPSATSAPSSFRDSALLSPSGNPRHAHSRTQSRSPRFRGRSISPLPGQWHHDDASRSPKSPVTPLTPRTNANIPPASKIPRIYALTELLALASSPSIALSPSQRTQLDAHIPLMTRKPSSPKSQSSPSPSPKTTSPAPLDGQTQAPKKPEQQQRRRRSGRKAPNASLKARVVPADVEGRRRRNAYGAGWGWPAAPLDGSRNVLGFESASDSWRAERLVAAA